MVIPVRGVAASALRDTFAEGRPGHPHEAIDIAAPRGTPVLAAADGRLVKLFTSVPGGLTIYQFDADESHALYYAHLDRYAEGLQEGMSLRRGDVIGFVGSTGNALCRPARAPGATSTRATTASRPGTETSARPTRVRVRPLAWANRVPAATARAIPAMAWRGAIFMGDLGG